MANDFLTSVKFVARTRVKTHPQGEDKKKSLTQEARQKSDISDVCNTSNCVTVRPVRGHLTPKMNIGLLYQKFDAEYFLFHNFFEKSCTFRENSKKLFWGRI